MKHIYVFEVKLAIIFIQEIVNVIVTMFQWELSASEIIPPKVCQTRMGKSWKMEFTQFLIDNYGDVWVEGCDKDMYILTGVVICVKYILCL